MFFYPRSLDLQEQLAVRILPLREIPALNYACDLPEGKHREKTGKVTYSVPSVVSPLCIPGVSFSCLGLDARYCLCQEVARASVGGSGAILLPLSRPQSSQRAQLLPGRKSRESSSFAPLFLYPLVVCVVSLEHLARISRPYLVE